ncbi:hypothetical protein, partial [Clostridium sp.]|uniref:hypothetical protein n=1 Tax=Clostridium sp. TaxID=1506 RepID=UPI0025C55F31
HLANEYLKQNKFDDANTVLSSMLEVDVENTDALNLKAQITKAIQKQKEDKIAAEAKAEAMKKDAMRLNSQGHFIDERHYNLYLNGQEDEYNLSGLYITLENLNGNKADIDFAFYSQGGSVPCHGSGPATYVGNGEWRFAFVNSTFFRYGIAIFKVKGDTAYLAIKEESYKFNGEYSDGLDPNNIKTFQEKDYNEINAGHFNTAYRTEHSYL